MQRYFASIEFFASAETIAFDEQQTRGFILRKGGGMSRWGVLSMVVRQIIRNGGFDPEDVARLDAAFTAAWKQIECRYDLASDMERDATRERLAVIIVTLGKSCHEIDAVELQARALAMFDQNGGGPPPPAGRPEIAPGTPATQTPHST